MSHPTLSDLVGELDGLPTSDLRALARAIEAELERRQKPRKLL